MNKFIKILLVTIIIFSISHFSLEIKHNSSNAQSNEEALDEEIYPYHKDLPISNYMEESRYFEMEGMIYVVFIRNYSHAGSGMTVVNVTVDKLAKDYYEKELAKDQK